MGKKGYYRDIKTSFWEDSKVAEHMNIYERYFFLYLMTNPHTNLSGLYEITRKQMCDESGLSRKQIDELIERLTDLGIILYDDDTSEVLIVNWSRHNWNKSKKVLIGAGKELAYCKSSKLFDCLEKYLRHTEYYLKGNDDHSISIWYRYGKDTISAEQESELEQESESGSEKSDLSSSYQPDISVKPTNDLTVKELHQIAKDLNLTQSKVIKTWGDLQSYGFRYGDMDYSTADRFISYLKNKYQERN